MGGAGQAIADDMDRLSRHEAMISPASRIMPAPNWKDYKRREKEMVSSVTILQNQAKKAFDFRGLGLEFRCVAL
jgi:hypothetical protein